MVVVGEERVRYAVVGLGRFAQRAIVPSFFHAARNSDLVAIVGEDEEKRAALAARWGVASAVGYERYDELLASRAVDAVYLACPAALHADLCLRAARAGVHVLCERPLAVTEEEAEHMLAACHMAGVKLMTGYRTHFDPAHADAVETVLRGRIGEPRLFASTYTVAQPEGNVRERSALGGGPLYELGAECVHAARALFRDEPEAVAAFAGGLGHAPHLRDAEQRMAVTMRFPRDRLATFAVGFGVAAMSAYELVGDAGWLRLDPAYEPDPEVERTLVEGERVRRHRYAAHDPIAPELLHFSDCILRDEVPEPSGEEGLVDVRVVRAIYRSAAEGRAVALENLRREVRPLATERAEIAVDAPHAAHGPRQ